MNAKQYIEDSILGMLLLYRTGIPVDLRLVRLEIEIYRSLRFEDYDLTPEMYSHLDTMLCTYEDMYLDMRINQSCLADPEFRREQVLSHSFFV
jgi:hypothetical protein